MRSAPTRAAGPAASLLAALLCAAPVRAADAPVAAATAPAQPAAATEPAHVETAADPAPPLLLHPTPPDPGATTHRARMALWMTGYLALQVGIYSQKAPPTAVRYGRRITPWDKLAHGAWSLDANTLRTNFVAHPIMGASMYQMARGARLGPWEAALWSAAGSAAWELCEYHERGSLNDLVVTPVGGVALGEPLHQLGLHLDRLPYSTGREVLAWVVSPWRRLNDLVDGVRPPRDGPDGRLAVTAFAEAAWASGTAWERPQVAAGLGWRLTRVTGYGEPGRSLRPFGGGEITGLAASASASRGRVEDARIESVALLGGAYARDLSPDGRGGDLLLGAGVALDLRRHAWIEAGSDDSLGVVHLPRLHAEARWLAGGLTLTGRLDAALALGGIRSTALDRSPDAVAAETLPTVQRRYRYHFGAGPALRPALALHLGPASLEAGLRGDWLWPVDRPDPAPGARPDARLEDRWTEASLRAAVALPGGLSLSAGGQRADRWSRAGAFTVRDTEVRWALTLGWAGG